MFNWININYVIHSIIALSMIAVVGPLAYWTFDRTPPIEIVSSVEITPQIKAGESFRYEQEIFRDELCHTVIERRLIDGANILHHFTPITREAGGTLAWPDSETRIISIKIPEDVSPGQSILQVSATFRCNPVHQLWPIRIQLTDHYFEVLPNDITAQLRQLEEQGLLRDLPEAVERSLALPPQEIQ